MAWFTVDTTYAADKDLLQAIRPRHREYLTRLIDAGSVVVAGPWADDSGGFTIFQVVDRRELDALLAQDPYTTDGVAAARDVREWKPVLGSLGQ